MTRPPGNPAAIVRGASNELAGGGGSGVVSGRGARGTMHGMSGRGTHALKWILPGGLIAVVGGAALVAPAVQERRERERAVREEAERVERFQATFQRRVDEEAAAYVRQERQMRAFRLRRKQRDAALTADEERELADLTATPPADE